MFMEMVKADCELLMALERVSQMLDCHDFLYETSTAPLSMRCLK